MGVIDTHSVHLLSITGHTNSFLSFPERWIGNNKYYFAVGIENSSVSQKKKSFQGYSGLFNCPRQKRHRRKKISQVLMGRKTLQRPHHASFHGDGLAPYSPIDI
jgi:hypothetical protein